MEAETLLGLIIAIVFFGATFCGVVGFFIGKLKTRELEGFILGLILGPLGWLIAALLPDAGRAKREEAALELQREHVAQLKRANELAKSEKSGIQSTPSIAPQVIITDGKQTALSQPSPSKLLPVRQYRLAKDGKEIGTKNPSEIRSMLARGEIEREDFYLDEVANKWSEIGTIPGV